MKKIITITSLIFSSFSCSIYAQNVTIPDANFKTELVANTIINTNGDNEIQLSEAHAFTGSINVETKNILDLTGIESFINITELICYNNSIASLDVSSNTALKRLHCGFNPITNINFGTSPIDYIQCDLTNITTLDISNLPVDTFIFRHNVLSNFTTGNNTTITYLDLNDNGLTSLDVSNNINLKVLNVYVNSISTLDLSNLSQLTYLKAHFNSMTSIDVSNNFLLEYLTCGANLLTSIDISNNIALKIFACDLNFLTSLDVSNNLALENLEFYDNQITSIDLSNNVNLKKFGSMKNELTNLDLSNNPNLTFVTFNENPLSIINLKNGNNTNITFFDVRNTPTLSCVEVDNSVYSASNWINISNPSIFSNACVTKIEKITPKPLSVVNKRFIV